MSVSLSVCPSVRMEQLGSHRMYFHYILYFKILGKSVEKIQDSSKSDKNNGYFAWTPIYIYDNISHSSSKNEKRFKQNFYRKSKHPFRFNNFFPRKPWHLWDNAEKFGTAGQATYDNIMRCMCFACWINEVRDRHSEYVIVIAFSQQECLSCLFSACLTLRNFPSYGFRFGQLHRSSMITTLTKNSVVYYASGVA